MSVFLRDRWPLAETSTVFMNGSAAYNLTHPTKPGMLGTVKMTPAQAAEFRAGVADMLAEAKAQALEEAAEYLSQEGVLWRGDSGVTVRNGWNDRTAGVNLTRWLRDRAQHIREDV